MPSGQLRVIRRLEEWKRYRSSPLLAGKSVGIVPTMGALHKGHGALIERSVSENDVTLLTIFVNRTQFNNPADFHNYPNTWLQDLALAEKMGVAAVLSPPHEDLYPDHYRFRVMEREVGLPMEGKHRPGHFDGVLTIVLKLLLLARADRAYFGLKDYQQYVLVRDMAEALFISTEIIGCPTVREEDGLACSSRNLRLTPEQRALAPKFYERLTQSAPCEKIAQLLQGDGFEVEYVEELPGRRLAAVRLGEVRLIDNVPL